VAKGVDAERAMLENNQAGNSGDEKGSKGRAPAAPCVTNNRGKHKGNRCSEPMNITMLPHNEGILLQIGDIIERRTGIELEEEPADVCVKQALRDAVRIIIMVHMFVMTPMLARPQQDGVFKRAGSENERQKFNDPVSLESEMCKQPVITKRDRKAASKEHHEEKDHLESIDAKKPEICRDCGEREK